jgi:hypothetical protein
VQGIAPFGVATLPGESLRQAVRNPRGRCCPIDPQLVESVRLVEVSGEGPMWCPYLKLYGENGRDSTSNNVETQHESLTVPTASPCVLCVRSKKLHFPFGMFKMGGFLLV